MRGSVETYISDVNLWWYNDGSCDRLSRSGRQKKYPDKAIIACIYIKFIYNLGYRQTEGFISSVLPEGFESPSHSVIQNRFAKMTQEEIERLNKIKSKVRGGQDSVILIDATGVSIEEGENWRKSKNKGRKSWKKLHVAVNHATQAVCSWSMTDSSDGEKIQDLILDCEEIPASVHADGAYHWNCIFNFLAKFKITPFIPLPINAVLSDEYSDCIQLTSRDKVFLDQYNMGGVDEWKKKSGYHKRSLVETFFSRFKRIFGGKFKTKLCKKSELTVKIALLNLFISDTFAVNM
jgi:hypothetical protein